MLSPVQVAHGIHSQRDRANTLGFGPCRSALHATVAEPNNLDTGQIRIGYHRTNARVKTLSGATGSTISIPESPRSVTRPYAGRTPVSARRVKSFGDAA